MAVLELHVRCQTVLEQLLFYLALQQVLLNFLSTASPLNICSGNSGEITQHSLQSHRSGTLYATLFWGG